jgi:hypothetical protein
MNDDYSILLVATIDTSLSAHSPCLRGARNHKLLDVKQRLLHARQQRLELVPRWRIGWKRVKHEGGG